jgi:hypothetical protein
MELFYLKEHDIYFIDYSGYITLDKGIFNMDFLVDKFKGLSISGNQLKILLDVRNTQWESIEIHNELSKIARKIFDIKNINCEIHMAVLNSHMNSFTFKNEHWFTKKEDAIAWLKSM